MADKDDDARAGIIGGAVILGGIACALSAINSHYEKKKKEKRDLRVKEILAEARVMGEAKAKAKAEAERLEEEKARIINCPKHGEQPKCGDCGDCVECGGGPWGGWCYECEEGWNYRNNDSD